MELLIDTRDSRVFVVLTNNLNVKHARLNEGMALIARPFATMSSSLAHAIRRRLPRWRNVLNRSFVNYNLRERCRDGNSTLSYCVISGREEYVGSCTHQACNNRPPLLNLPAKRGWRRAVSRAKCTCMWIVASSPRLQRHRLAHADTQTAITPPA